MQQLFFKMNYRSNVYLLFSFSLGLIGVLVDVTGCIHIEQYGYFFHGIYE